MTKTGLLGRLPVIGLSTLYGITGSTYIITAIEKIASLSRPDTAFGAIGLGCGVLLVISAVKIYRNGFCCGAVQMPGIALSAKIAIGTAAGVGQLEYFSIPVAIVLFAMTAFMYAIEEVEPGWDE
jgi:hypothetical protein